MCGDGLKSVPTRLTSKWGRASIRFRKRTDLMTTKFPARALSLGGIVYVFEDQVSPTIDMLRESLVISH